jgi:hypothetical protein
MSFYFDEAQMYIKFTQYSVLDFLSETPAFILLLVKVAQALVPFFANVQFNINVLQASYIVKVSKSNQQIEYG